MVNLVKAIKQILVGISLLGYALTGFALPEDQKEIVHLQSNTADLSQQTHLGVYKGNVHFEQGSTHLTADSAETKGNEQNKLTFAKALGNTTEQAHYWTLTDPNKPPMHAYADEIYYYPLKHRIELIGNARVEQGNNSFSAPKIVYDILDQHVVTENSQHMGRTTIIIHPEPHS